MLVHTTDELLGLLCRRGEGVRHRKRGEAAAAADIHNQRRQSRLYKNQVRIL